MESENLHLDLPELILTLRKDLCDRFGFDKPRNWEKYLRWLMLTGVREYPVLDTDLSFRGRLNESLTSIGSSLDKHGLSTLQRLVLAQRPDVKAAITLPKKRKLFEQWFFTHAVEEMNVLPYFSERELEIVRNHPEPWKSRLAPFLAENEARRAAATPCLHAEPLPFGVNLIGFANGQLGIGEDLRMAARALLAAGVPIAIVNFPPGKEVAQNDRTFEDFIVYEGPFVINLFCLSALEHGRFYAERGSQQMQGRYNIGYWPWELAKWPPEWNQLVCLTDEVWVSTKFTAEALAPHCPVPLFVMPMAVELGEISCKTRADFGLPESATLFCFSFDLNSSMARKNPQACLKAFQKAFPKSIAGNTGRGDDDVGMVIKAHAPSSPSREWDKLKRLAARDARIFIIEETLDRPDLLALYQCCDCFLSLHRAEGFGRGLAEFLLLGLHLIATGYSGNMDFCSKEGVDLVDFRLIKIRKGEYPFSNGQVWADADVDHAAGLMRRFHQRGAKAPYPGRRRFSVSSVGARYLKRLSEIQKLLSGEGLKLEAYPRVHPAHNASAEVAAPVIELGREYPRVSVVMPSFNQVKYLPEAVESVLGQDFRNLELVVQDGGSTDGSVEFLRSVSGRDARVKWESCGDSGPAEAIARAVQRAESEIIGWLNADDLFTPEAVGTAAGFFGDLPCKCMFYGEGKLIDAGGAFLENYPTLPPRVGIEQFHNGCFLSQPAVFFQKRAYNELGGLDTNLRASFDMDLWMRFFLSEEGKISYIRKPLVASRIHANTITANQRGTVAREGMQLCHRYLGGARANWLLSYFWEEYQGSVNDAGTNNPIDGWGKLFEESRQFLTAESVEQVEVFLETTPIARWMSQGLFFNVSQDLWAGEELVIDLRGAISGIHQMLEIRILNERPDARSISVTADLGVLGRWSRGLVAGEEITWLLPLAMSPEGQAAPPKLICFDLFSPKNFATDSNDDRLLAYRVLDAKLV